MGLNIADLESEYMRLNDDDSGLLFSYPLIGLGLG